MSFRSADVHCLLIKNVEIMAWGSKKSMSCSRALQSKADFHVFRKTIFGFHDPGFEGSVFKTENFRYQCMAHEIVFCSIENGSTKQTKQRGSCVDIALLFSTKLKQNLFRKQKSKGR